MTEPFAPFTLHTGIEIDLEAEDALAKLRALHGSAHPLEWCMAAAQVMLRLVDDYETDDAHSLLNLVIATLPVGGAAAFLIELAANERLKYEEEYIVVALNAAFELQPTIDTAMKLVRALHDDLQEDKIAAVIDRVAGNDYAIQQQFFAPLGDANANEALIDLARRTTPTKRGDKLVRATVLAHALARKSRLDERALVLPELEDLVADHALDRVARLWAYLELRTTHHLQTAFELARISPLPSDLARMLAGALERAGELVCAETLLLANPMPDEPQYLESVQRKLGTLAWPPADAFIAPPEPPPEPGSIFEFFDAKGALPEGFVAAFTRSERTVMLRENRAVMPEKIREWSHGAIRKPEDLDSEKIFGPIRSFVCHCELYVGVKYRGYVCERCGTEVISNTVRAYRPAHIMLERPVIHPWYGATLATLLRIRQSELNTAGDLRDQLRRVDIHWIAVELEGKRRTKAEEQLFTVVTTFRDSTVRPDWLVLELVPVWAPDAELPAGVDREKLRAAYVALLGNPEPQTAVDALYGCFG